MAFPFLCTNRKTPFLPKPNSYFWESTPIFLMMWVDSQLLTNSSKATITITLVMSLCTFRLMKFSGIQINCINIWKRGRTQYEPKSQDSNFVSRHSVRTQIPLNTRVIRKKKFVPTLLSQIQTQSIQHKQQIQKGTKKD